MCPTSVPEIISSTIKKAVSETPIVHTTITLPKNDLTKIPAYETTPTRSEVIHSNDSSDEKHPNSTFPEASTVGNSISQPLKRQSATEIVSLMTSHDPITSIETGRSHMPSSSSFTARPSMSQTSSISTTPVITKTITNPYHDFSSASTSREVGNIATTSELTASYSGHSASTPHNNVDTITTPLSVVSNNPHTIDVTEKYTKIQTTPPITVPNNIQPTSQAEKTAETLTSPRLFMLDDSSSISAMDKVAKTTPLLVEFGDTQATLTTEKNREMSASLPVTTSSFDETSYVRIEQRGSVEELSTNSKFPSGRRANPGRGKSNIYTTPQMVTTEMTLPIDPTKFAVTDNVGKVLASASTELQTTYQLKRTEGMTKSKYGTTSTARPQRHDTGTPRYAHTTEPDFDIIIPAKKISESPRSTRALASSISTATAADGTVLLELIMTTASIPPSQKPPKKTTTSGGNEVLLASTAFPTTIVIICVVAVVIAFVIIIVLVVICRGKMNKSGKYNISSEMNSMAGDESGDAKIVKVHYNDTNA